MSDGVVVRRSEQVRLTDLVTGLDPSKWWIRETIFEDCTILGPAVVWGDILQVRDSVWDGTPESIVYAVPDEADTLTGVIGIKACLFERCRFSGIGIAVKQSAVEDFLAGFNRPDES